MSGGSTRWCGDGRGALPAGVQKAGACPGGLHPDTRTELQSPLTTAPTVALRELKDGEAAQEPFAALPSPTVTGVSHVTLGGEEPRGLGVGTAARTLRVPSGEQQGLSSRAGGSVVGNSLVPSRAVMQDRETAPL